MDKNIAPTQQLLITRDTIGDIINKIYVKKSDIVNPIIVETLRHLCDKVDKNPQRMLTVFSMRKQILENASEIYIDGGEDDLFAEVYEELDVILEILKDHTITK